MLGKLFSKEPQWQSADPAQRLAAVAELEPNAAQLFTLACDSELAVRKAALAKITDLSALSEQLGAPYLPAQWTERVVELLGQAEPAQREALLTRLGDEAAMARLAVHAPTNAVRMAAAQRVHSTDLLKTVSDEARERDHGVSKYARERLDAMASETGRAAQAQAICAALEMLVHAEGAVTSQVVELDRRYGALQPNAPLAERFASARATLAVRFEREQAQQRERNQWLKDFEQLRIMQQTAEVSPATLMQARTAYAELEQRAAAHPDLHARMQQSGARHAIELLERTLAAQGEADALLHDFAPAVDAPAKLVEFEDKWNAIAPEGRDTQRQQQFDDLLAGHRRQFKVVTEASAAEQAQARQKLHTLLAQAEAHLAEGEIQKAAAARDEMKPLRATAGELPKPTNQRLGRLAQQLGDLLRWQAFGNATQREEMCSQAENMPKLALPVGELAKQVQALRDGWKQLDQTQAPAPRALWERFNAACEIAYAPAAEHFAKQAEERKAALARREVAIKEISDYAALALTANIDVPDWKPDWKAIGTHLARADSTWRTLGHVDRKKMDAIEAKWSAATKPLRDGIKGVQHDEASQREKLIASVKALIGTDGKLVGGAVAKVKDAQTHWQTRAKSFPLPRKQEQAMWEQFRSGCNTVFDALGAEKSARQSAFSEAETQRRALIDQYATLAQSNDEKAIRAAIAEAPKQWAKLGDAGRDTERKLADRFDKTLRGLRDALRDSEKNKGQLQLLSLLSAARACAMLETAVLAGNVPTPQIAESELAHFDALSPLWKQKMLARKAQAERATPKFAAQVDIDRTKFDKTLSELEMELGIVSPHLSAQERMQLQVARLANRMKTGAAMPAQDRFVELCALATGEHASAHARLQTIATQLLTTPTAYNKRA